MVTHRAAIPTNFLVPLPVTQAKAHASSMVWPTFAPQAMIGDSQSSAQDCVLRC
jgi:hypothetical protein